jgi:hypothetical protein
MMSHTSIAWNAIFEKMDTHPFTTKCNLFHA